MYKSNIQNSFEHYNTKLSQLKDIKNVIIAIDKNMATYKQYYENLKFFIC